MLVDRDPHPGFKHSRWGLALAARVFVDDGGRRLPPERATRVDPTRPSVNAALASFSSIACDWTGPTLGAGDRKTRPDLPSLVADCKALSPGFLLDKD